MDLNEIIDIFISILPGVKLTILYAVLSAILGFLIAIFLLLMRFSKIFIFEKISIFYISVFRGTPLLLQLYLVYYLFGKIEVFFAALIAFGLNSGAYMAEILRSGIKSVDVGQFEAAKVLQIKPFYAWKDIIFPQAFKNIMPAFFSEITMLVKETSIVSVLGSKDIMYMAKIFAAANYSALKPLIIAGIIYYILVVFLSRISKFMERVLWSK